MWTETSHTHLAGLQTQKNMKGNTTDKQNPHTENNLLLLKKSHLQNLTVTMLSQGRPQEDGHDTQRWAHQEKKERPGSLAHQHLPVHDEI